MLKLHGIRTEASLSTGLWQQEPAYDDPVPRTTN